MRYMRGIVAKHPSYPADHNGELVACIEACFSAAAATAACTDACLADPHADVMATCIRLNMDACDLAGASARILTRHIGHLTQAVIAQVNTLAAVLQACAVECSQHGDAFEHCAICAEACRACAESCRRLSGASAGVQATPKGIDQESALH